MAKSILGEFKDINRLGFNNQIENVYYKDIQEAKKNRALRNIDGLAEDIAEAGLEDNLVVRKIESDNAKYELVAGHRRYNAILKNIDKGDMTYEYIPCKVLVLEELDARKRLILNNFYADPLTESEKIDVIEELRNIYKIKKEQGEKIPGRIQSIIADEVGLKKSQVGNYEKIINNAIPEVREKIEKGELTITAASELCSLNDDEQLMFIEENDDLSLTTIKEYKKSLEEEDYEEMDLETIEDYDVDPEEAFCEKEKVLVTGTKTIHDCIILLEEDIVALVEKLSGVEWNNERVTLKELQDKFNEFKSVMKV